MSTMMDEEIKRWTARRKAALVVEILQGKTTIAEASRLHDLPPSEIDSWADDAKRGMENALRANRWRSARSTSASSSSCKKRMAKPCWSCAPEKSWHPYGGRTRNDSRAPAGADRRRCGGERESAVSLVRCATTDGVLPGDQVAAQDRRGACVAGEGVD